jgi:hypothetical protein
MPWSRELNAGPSSNGAGGEEKQRTVQYAFRAKGWHLTCRVLVEHGASTGANICGEIKQVQCLKWI